MIREQKQRIETVNAPPSTGFRSQGLIAGGILFTGGQIGAEMPEPGVFREPCTEMKEAVQVTLRHLEQVTLAAGCSKAGVFEVSAFPKTPGSQEEILAETEKYLGKKPLLFNYCQVFDTAAHSLIEMDWMAITGSGPDAETAAGYVHPLGNGPSGQLIESGPFRIWNKLSGYGPDLGVASKALLDDILAKLQALGGDYENLLKLTVYIKEFDPYPLFNEATRSAFAEIIPPTRSVLVAPEITRDAQICVDVIALR